MAVLVLLLSFLDEIVVVGLVMLLLAGVNIVRDNVETQVRIQKIFERILRHVLHLVALLLRNLMLQELGKVVRTRHSQLVEEGILAHYLVFAVDELVAVQSLILGRGFVGGEALSFGY